MKKAIKIIISILIFTLIITVLYFSFLPKKIVNLRIFSAVPPNYLLLVQSSDLFQNYSDIYNSQIWQQLSQLKEIQEVNKTLTQLNKFAVKTKIPNKFFKNRSIIFSLFQMKDKVNFLIVFDLKNLRKLFPYLEKYIKSYSSYKLFQIKLKNFNTPITKIVNMKNQLEVYYLCQQKNILLISDNLKLIEKSLQTSQSKYWNHHPQLKKFIKQNFKKQTINLSIYFPSLYKYLNDQQTSDNLLLKLVLNGLTYGSFNLAISNNTLALHGNVLIDSVASLPAALANTSPSQPSAYTIFSDNTAAFVSISPKHLANLINQMLQVIKNYNPQQFEKTKKQINLVSKLLGINIEKDIIPWLGNEISIFQIPPKTLRNQEQYAVVINTNNPNLAMQKMKKIFKKTSHKSPLKYKTISYRGFNINYLKSSILLKLLFPKIAKNLQLPYYTFISSYIIMTSNIQTLKQIIDDYYFNYTLDNLNYFSNFISSFDKKSNLSAFAFTPNLFPIILKYTPSNQRYKLLKNKKLIMSFCCLGLQLKHSDKKQLSLSFKILLNPSAYKQWLIYKSEKQTELHSLLSLLDSLKFKIQIPDSLKDKTSYLIVKYPNNNIQFEGNILNGNPYGLWKTFYPDGNIKTTQLYNAQGLLNGFVEFFYDNNANSKWAELQVTNGQLNGTFTEFYPNGNKKLVINFLNNQKNGPIKVFYPNGKLKLSGQYKNNIKTGKWIIFSENGKKILTENWSTSL